MFTLGCVIAIHIINFPRLARRLQYQEEDPVLAKDANLKSDDWFEITDPRNVLNKRRRGEDKHSKRREHDRDRRK